MKSKTLYTCEVCHTDYADKETARQCEKSHKTNIKNTIPLFKPMHMGVWEYPYTIVVEFDGGKKIIYRT